MSCISLRIIIIIFFYISPIYAKSASWSSEIKAAVSMVKNMSCETEDIGHIISSEYSNTCIPEAMLSAFIGGLKTLGLNVSMMGVTKMHGNTILKNNCKFNERAVWIPGKQQPKIDFAICNDAKLEASRQSKLLNLNTYMGLAKEVIAGKGYIKAIADAWNVKDKDAYEQYSLKPGQTLNTGLFSKVTAKVSQDTICINASSKVPLLGEAPIGCKYILDPYGYKYANSFWGGKNGSQDGGCIFGSCYSDVYNASKTLVTITGPIVQCVNIAIDRLIGSGNDGPIQKFQKSMQKIIMLFITIYICIMGYRIALQGKVPTKKELMIDITKIILVIYFAIGINSGGGEYKNGLLDILFPILHNGSEQMASWVLNSSDVTSNGLCVFPPSDYPKAKFANMSLWDSLDCRVAYYLGINSLSEAIGYLSEINFSNVFTELKGALDVSIPLYIWMIIPTVMTGQFLFMQIGIAYPILIMVITAFVVQYFITAFIILAVLITIGPIIIPMALFNQTKSYFDSWLRITFAFMFQPMIVVIFVCLMFKIYDNMYYASCKYEPQNFFSTGKKYFTLTADSKKNSKCMNSIGMWINPSLAKIGKTAWSLTPAVQAEEMNKVIKDSADKHIVKKEGIFCKIYEIGKGIADFMWRLLLGLVVLYLLYNISSQIASFASDLSLGLNLQNMLMDPKAAYGSVMSAISAAGGAAAGGGKAAVDSSATPQGKGGASDLMGKGGNAKDMISSTGKNQGSEDLVGKGNGEKKDSGDKKGGAQDFISKNESPTKNTTAKKEDILKGLAKDVITTEEKKKDKEGDDEQ